MGGLNILRFLTGIIFIVVLLGGCAANLPPPKMAKPESAGIAIEMTMQAPVGFFTSTPDQVYFAKIDGEGGLLQQSIIRSNYVKGNRVYLLNITPGTYVAVASLYSVKGPGSSGGSGVSLSIGNNSNRFTTYLSKDFVEQTKIIVGPGEFKFMGDYLVSMGMGLDGADEVQRHYQNIIAPGAEKAGLMNVLSGDNHYRGSVAKANNDEQTRNKFVQDEKKDLAGSGWEDLVK